MNMICQGLFEQYESLKKFHYKTLHELAGAAQIIKSYEFLERTHKREQQMLENVVRAAERLCETNDFSTLLDQRAELKDAVLIYRSSRKTRKMLQKESKTIN